MTYVSFPPTLLLAFLIATSFSGCESAPVNAPDNPEKTVRSAWESYAKALDNKDASAALLIPDNRTFDYCTRLIDLALHADSSALVQERISDRMTVLLMRAACPVSFLDTATGRGYFRFALENGLVGERKVITDFAKGNAFLKFDITAGPLDQWNDSGLELGAVEVKGDTAWAAVKGGGQEIALKIPFYRHGNEWKPDITAVYPLFDQLMTESQRIVHWSESEYVEYWVGKPLKLGLSEAQALWKPLKP